MFLDDKPSLYGISLCLKQLSQEAAQLDQPELSHLLRDAALMADSSIAENHQANRQPTAAPTQRSDSETG